MPASYPNSVKIFTTKTTGQVILASHINEPQDEITAIEQGLLQGLAHALFPNTDVGQDLGTATKRWRSLLVQKIAAGITNATRLRVQEVGTSTWITVNADFDGTNWNREDTAQPAQAVEINSAKEVKYYRAAAGANPITWTNIFTISTDRITASQAVIGTDPGGTEVLRAQNLRAGATQLTDTLTAPSAVVGTDPGGTEVLRAQNLRAGATALTGTLTAPTVVAGTDPGGTETLRAQTLRAGNTTLTGTLTAPSAVVGTDPGGTETLRAQDLRAGAITLTGTLSAPTVVAGADPGGTESLRAGSARLNAPVLLGSVPQFTVATDPTAALQVATKQYADTKLARGTAETITARHTFDPSTAGAPFLLGANASGQLVTGLNADMVDGLHASEITRPPTISVFPTPGSYTWNKPTGCKKIWIRCWGAGGGGGGANGGTSSSAGGGGAGGNYAEKLLDVTGISSATVTVGAGGATEGSGGSSSFAVGTTVYARATGGAGGQNGTSGTDGAGGTSTTGSIGDFVARGENGWRGMRSINLGGRGGGSPAGGTGSAAFPGAGGDGAFAAAGAGSVAGNNGADGLVVIVEFY